MKTAIITGASSGIGAEFAKLLAADGWKLILVARRADRLEKLASELGTPCRVITADLSKTADCISLYEQTKDEETELLINNAGFGLLGDFDKTELDRELQMISVNCTAVMTVMKLFLPDMIARNKGKILNVASAAAFTVGPLMSGYYASKAYALRLSQSVNYELIKRKSAVRVAALCPGPVDTEFNSVAGSDFAMRAQTAEYVAVYALKKLFAGKTVICPSFSVRIGRFAARFSPDRVLGWFGYRIQSGKKNKKAGG